MTARTGQLGQYNRDGTTMAGRGHDRKAGRKHLGQHTGQAIWGRPDRLALTGQKGQDGYGITAKTGQQRPEELGTRVLGQDSRKFTVGTEQPERTVGKR
jgi:hypothetical protein